MTKYSKTLFLLIVLGSLASCNADLTNPPAVTSRPEDILIQAVEDSSIHTSNTAPIPTLQAAPYRHKSGAARVEIAAYGEATDEDYDDVYLWAEEAVFDMLISEAARTEKNGVETYVETDILLYVPAVAPGQCVTLYGFKGITGLYLRIAYTNNRGEHETVLLLDDKTKESVYTTFAPVGVPEEAFDREKDGYFQRLSAEFRTKMLAGAFDAFIPNGFRIAAGSLGDVNADGLEDALVGLVSHTVSSPGITGVMPLLVLTGQPEGGYAIAKKVPSALFLPYRSSAEAIAGEGYIDIVYYQVGGAACHHTLLNRFIYDDGEKDWLLDSFSHRQSYTSDYESELPPELVRVLSHLAGLPIAKFNEKLYEHLPDWGVFDATAVLTVPAWGDDNYHYIYTLGVSVNEQTGYYEGYIYKHFESIGADCFEQTVRGVFEEGSEMVLTVNEEEKAFQIQADIWMLEPVNGEGFYRMAF